MFVSVMGVIVYRVVVAVDYCPNIDPSACLVVTSLVSSLLNAISILILGKVSAIQTVFYLLR